jgi:hypothetical protein
MGKGVARRPRENGRAGRREKEGLRQADINHNQFSDIGETKEEQ